MGECQEPDYCSDTDGGVVFDVQGTVSGYDNGSPYNYTDYCNGTMVMEYYCSGNDWYTYPESCNGNYTTCSNGACV